MMGHDAWARELAEQDAADQALWTPYMTFLAVGLAAQILGVACTQRAPLVLAAILGLSALPIAYSFFADVALWGHAPGSQQWSDFFLKWVLVVPLAGVPLLFVKALRPSARMVNAVAILLNLILVANIAFAFVVYGSTMIETGNLVPAAMLGMSIVLKVLTLWLCGEPLAEIASDGSYVFFYSTPTPWVASYTLWNAVFTWELGNLETAFQVAYFWCFMLYFYNISAGTSKEIGYYFGFSRGVSLSVFGASTLFCGLSPSLTQARGDPPMQQDQASLFLVWINMAFASYLTAMDLRKFCSALRVNFPCCQKPDMEAGAMVESNTPLSPGSQPPNVVVGAKTEDEQAS